MNFKFSFKGCKPGAHFEIYRKAVLEFGNLKTKCIIDVRFSPDQETVNGREQILVQGSCLQSVLFWEES